MPAKLNLIGQKFGRLTVISEAPKKGRDTAWCCMCACGETVLVSTTHLRAGHTKSCGCAKREASKKLLTRHGGKGTRLYSIWKHIRQRCYDANSTQYKWYGGRGITVSDEWSDFAVFRSWALSNGYADNLTIDRINVNGNYAPSNCRWVTMKDQARNTRANAVFNGKCLAEWSEETGIPYDTLKARLQRYGWPLERAISEPVRRR